jgi:two-component system, OmpR family, KDP operon response regulator KdpE
LSSFKNVFMISDDPELISRLTKVLVEPEYRVFCANRTDKKLRLKINQFNPDLIIVDPEIPTLKGISLSLLLRQWMPAPILILSAARTQDNEIRALDMEADECLSEPFDAGVVSVRIDRIISPSCAF